MCDLEPLSVKLHKPLILAVGVVRSMGDDRTKSETHFETFFFDACDSALRLLPDDNRINKVKLKHALAERWQTYKNPNTVRFYDAVKKIPVGDGQLVPNVNGPVEVQLPQNLDLKEALQGLVIAKRAISFW